MMKTSRESRVESRGRKRFAGSQLSTLDPRPKGAFTLLEIMVVVAIMAIVLTVSIPFIRTAIDSPTGMRGAFKAIEDACRDARAMAILQQTTTELRIRDDGTLEVGAVGTGGSSSRLESHNLAGEEWRMPDRAPSKPSGVPSTGPRKLPEGVGIEAILANGQDVTDLEVARIQFFPNGTCDELQIVLSHPESGEKRQVWVDVVTATVEFETDQYKFKVQ